MPPSWIARLVALDGAGTTFRTSKALGAGPRLFGGLIAAQALAAAAATVPGDRLPQSLHAYFIKGGRVGVDVEYTVEITRDGRSFNTRRVTAGQDGVPIFEMLASFHRPEATLDWQRPAVMRVPLAEATTVVVPPESWADYFEARVAPRETTPEWPQQPFWFRSREPIEDDPVLRACALTFVSDLGMVSTARPPGAVEPGPGGAASLDHALWLHRPVDPNQWHCYDAVGVSHRDARGLAFGAIHDAEGALVASVAQESLWRI
ncbi:MAG: thioesterase family protein [Mycobacterium sp.]